MPARTPRRLRLPRDLQPRLRPCLEFGGLWAACARLLELLCERCRSAQDLVTVQWSSCGTEFAEELRQRAVRYPYDKGLKAAAGDANLYQHDHRVLQGYARLLDTSADLEVEASRRREFAKPRLVVRIPGNEHQEATASMRICCGICPSAQSGVQQLL